MRAAAGDAAGTVQRVGSKAKVPALVGGAVLAGVAGAVAIARNGRKGSRIPLVGGGRGAGDSTRKALGGAAKALGEVAVEVGKTGLRVGELTSEVRRVREQAQRDA